MSEIFYKFSKQTANTIEVLALIDDHEFRRVMTILEFEHFSKNTLNPCDTESNKGDVS